jgi:hypothetical protein
MTRNIIKDGFTVEARINPVSNLHEGLDFSFRPMLPEEYEEAEANIDPEKPREIIHIIAKWLKVKLATWSEVDKDGNEAPITFENIRCLQPTLLRRLYRIVAGSEAHDLPIKGSPESQQNYLDTIGKPQGAALLETVGN